MNTANIDYDPPQPVAWRWLLAPALASLLMHLFTNGNYGMFRDEYYYLACADRPAWGYVDHPPLSIVILAVWKAIFGDSVASIRILPALCGSGLIFLTGAMAAALGGRARAQLLAGLAAGVGATALVVCGFYSMNAFDLLFWSGAYLLLIRLIRTGRSRLWLWLGIVLGLGLLNKIGLLVFGLCLGLGLIMTRHRSWLRHRNLWFAAGIAGASILPYVLWNMAHDWPTLEFIENAKRYKIADISPLEFLSQCTLEANPTTLPIWLGGLAWLLLARRARRFRILGLIFVLTTVVLIVQKSKPYYLAGSYPMLMAAGGCAWVQWTDRRRWHWFPWLLKGGLVVGIVILAPLVLPILSIPDFVEHQQRLGLVPRSAEVGHTSTVPQHFSDRLGWENQVVTVAEVYAGLSPEEQAACVVLARNYGQAGALEYYSRQYDLPPIACAHNNYYLWGPPTRLGEVMIVVGFGRDDLEAVFAEVEAAAEAVTPFALESPRTVWLCRGLLVPAGEAWERAKLLI